MPSWSSKAQPTDQTIDADGTPKQTTEPYVHWFHRTDAAEDTLAPRDKAQLSGEALQAFVRQYAQQEAQPKNGPAAGQMSRQVYGDGVLVPLPKGSLNQNGPSPWDHKDMIDDLPEVDPDTIIVGIIDTGISLGHRNFRDAAGKTRVISAWQQGAQFDSPDMSWRYLNHPKRSAQLPFGRELVSVEIDAALDRSSPTGPTGWLDEDSFNRALFLTSPEDPTGQRDLDHRAAHGTHILDLAAGHVPVPQNANAMAQQKIIAVNLPAQHAHGTAGTFLAYFAIYAMERILFMADALWIRNNPGSTSKQRGYPIVINFSYGMQAGPKDGSSLYERLMVDALKRRIDGANSEVRIVMPAGNENLNRGAATKILGKTGAEHDPTGYEAEDNIRLPWVLSPSDHTANYMEIWTESGKNTQEIEKRTRIFVTPPGQPRMAVPTLRDKSHADLTRDGETEPFARLYCQDLPDRKEVRRRYLLCTAPTQSFAPGAVLAPAGTWQIEIEYDGTPCDFAFHIQSDQSGVRQSRTAKRSYFDHPNYETHVLSHSGKSPAIYGGERDSFHYDPILGVRNAENWNRYGPVQRKGTHNALSAVSSRRLDDRLLCIAGYDETSGRPAVYSGSSSGDPNDKGRERSALSVAFPSESAPNHFGLLAAGSRNGSVVGYRGTSMATALATRHIVERFAEELKAPRLRGIGTENALRDEAAGNNGPERRDHWGNPMTWGFAPKLKLGVERLPIPRSIHKGRIKRLGV